MSTRELFSRTVLDARFVWAIGFAGCASLIGASVVLVGLPSQIWIAAIGLILGFGVALVRYRAAFIGFAFLLLAFFDFLGYRPLLTSPVNVFFADGIILMLGVILLIGLSRGTLGLKAASPITALLIVNLAFGFFSLLFGLGAGHQVNDVLGDFRRIFFYPLTVLVALGYVIRPKDIRRLARAFFAALFVISVVAIVRAVIGKTWDPAQFTRTDDFRAIGYFTGIIVIVGLGVSHGLSLVSGGYQKWMFRLISVLLLGVVFLSGYRMLWVLGLMTPLFVSYSTYRGPRGMLKLITALLIVLTLFLVVLIVAQRIFPDLYLLMRTKFEERVLGFSFRDNVRYFAWRAAWDHFVSSPITGIGIGDQFSFLGFDSAGRLHLYRLTTHNFLLTVLYQAGLIAAGLFVAIHLRVSWYVWKRLPKITARARAPLSGMFFGYLAALALGMFQPSFEASGAIVAFYLWTGLMLNLVRYYLRQKGSEVTGL
jgi:O-antigen ligase